jgi:hypothetical protein
MGDAMSEDNDEGASAPSATSILLTPSSMALVGSSVLVGSAIGTALLHYKSSEKKLLEEGVSTTARRAALPLATRALLASTIGCAVIGGIATVGYTVMGGEYLGSTRVDWGSVVESARRGSEVLRNEVHRRLKGRDDHSD